MSKTSDHNNTNLRGQRYFVLVFAFFSSWLLTFPFEGRILYALFNEKGIDAREFVLIVITCNFAGLISAGFFVKTSKRAEIVLKTLLLVCAASSFVYFTPIGMHWYVALPIAAYAAGVCLACFGYFFYRLTLKQQRFQTAADILIVSNVLMIVLNGIMFISSPKLVLSLAILFLLIAFFLSGRLFRMPEIMQDISLDLDVPAQNHPKVYTLKPLLILCIFILIVTIGSGLMYTVVNPAYSHLEWITGWYWAIPYVAVILLLRNLPKRIDRTYFLYIAISMSGISFLGFMILDQSVLSYIIVNTLMMGAYGIFDLFWWSILGEMLDDWPNRAMLFGTGLAANVLGVLIGSIAGSRISEPSIFAIFIAFASLIVLPVMSRYLSAVRFDYAFLKTVTEFTTQIHSPDSIIGVNSDMLTKREKEIMTYLLEGMTNRMIAAELHLSENTIKTHIKNIYTKLDIRSRSDLIRKSFGVKH